MIIPDFFLRFTPKFKIEYSLPFVNEIGPKDLTFNILFAGQYAYYIFFLLLTHLGFLISFDNIKALNIALWIFFGISSIFLLIVIYFTIDDYKASKKKKGKILKFLTKKLYEYDDEKIEIKIYYFQLANEIRRTPIIKMRLMSKIIAFITFIISIFPFIID